MSRATGCNSFPENDPFPSHPLSHQCRPKHYTQEAIQRIEGEGIRFLLLVFGFDALLCPWFRFCGAFLPRYTMSLDGLT